MKIHCGLVASVIVGFSLVTTYAQPQGPPRPSFDGAMSKLFGDNPDFSATMEMRYNRSSGDTVTMTGKMAHTENKFRFDMDMSNMQGVNIPPQAMEQMKKMGMDSMTSITRLDKKVTYIIYPNMKGYVENPMPDSQAKGSADYKVDTTKVGSEAVDGHDCVKNNVVMTGSDGVAHKATVWNATDLKQFPVKIEMTTDAGDTVAMHFTEIKLSKPDSAQFDPPTDCTKYDSMMNMMMSRYRGGGPPR